MKFNHMYNIGDLIYQGYTNAGTEDYGSLASAVAPVRISVPYCTSDKCCKLTTDERILYVKTKRVARRKKMAHRDADSCPDCKCTLVWKQEYKKG